MGGQKGVKKLFSVGYDCHDGHDYRIYGLLGLVFFVLLLIAISINQNFYLHLGSLSSISIYQYFYLLVFLLIRSLVFFWSKDSIILSFKIRWKLGGHISGHIFLITLFQTNISPWMQPLINLKWKVPIADILIMLSQVVFRRNINCKVVKH